MATWLPLLVMVTLWMIFSAGIPRDLPVAVVDLDNSGLSRKVTRYLEASPALRVVDSYSSVKEGLQAIQRGDVYALVSIPHQLEYKVYRGRSPAITAFFNAQYLLVAKLIDSTILEVETNIAVELEVARNLPHLPVIQAAMAVSMPVRAQITPLYNSNLNYGQFLVPGIVAALFQVVVCGITILRLGRPELKLPADAGSLFSVLTGNLLPYSLLYFAFGLLVLYFFFGFLQWPIQGALLPLVPAVLLFVLASQSLGVFFYAVAVQQVRALSIAGAFCAPAFAFLGVTFPQSDMSGFASFWRELMPAAHYLDAYTQQTSYAAGLPGQLQPSLTLLAYCILMPLAIWLIKSRLGRENEHISATA